MVVEGGNSRRAADQQMLDARGRQKKAMNRSEGDGKSEMNVWIELRISPDLLWACVDDFGEAVS